MMKIQHPFWIEAQKMLAKGRFKQAQPLVKTLLSKFPHATEIRYAYALICQELGEYESACDQYTKVIDDQSSHPTWHVNYGVSLLRSGRAHEAEYQFALSLRKEPRFPDEWLINYAIALNQNGKPDDAESALNILLNRSPNNVDAVLRYASLMTQREKHKESVPAWQRYIQLAPNDPVGYSNLGAAHFHLLNYVESEAASRAGLARLGNHVSIMANLACAVLGQNRLDEAEQIFEQALALEPDNVETVGAAVGLLHLVGMHDKAASLLERGVNRPDTGHEFRFLLSTVRLIQRRFDEGWTLSRDRWRSKHFKEPHAKYDMPEWRGEPLEGKGILVMCEQGLADQMQALTLIPELLATGAKVAVELDGRLIPIAQRSLPDVLFFPFSLPPVQPSNIDFNYYVAMGDLGGFFRRSLDDFARQPRVFLKPEETLVAKWRARLPPGEKPALRVGLTWRSLLMKDTQNGHVYPPLNHWLRLVKAHPDIEWVNLQYDKPGADLQSFEDSSGVTLLSWPDLDIARAQDDLAAMFQSLDLVLGVANAPVFLAAATGVRAWTTWTSRLRIYWKTHGLDYMPWAPDIRLFQRRVDVPWEQVFDELSQALTELKATKIAQPA